MYWYIDMLIYGPGAPIFGMRSGETNSNCFVLYLL